ncbi:MAG: DUF2250 domain-containing protein [Conexivisphaera sp.]
MKRSEAKLKLADEVHKHHTYYELTRDGEVLLRSLDDEVLMEGYSLALEGDRLALALLRTARRIGVDHALTYSRLVGARLEEVEGELSLLAGMGLMETPRYRVIKRGSRKAKPKPETRVHHRYYGLSREGELFLRWLDRRGQPPTVISGRVSPPADEAGGARRQRAGPGPQGRLGPQHLRRLRELARAVRRRPRPGRPRA